jgi:hypothetical protein
MTGLANIERILVSRELIDHTYRILRVAGQKGCEAFVLWLGQKERDVFTVTESLAPAQTAYKTSLGVCVKVAEDELHRLNVYLHENRLQLIAQIHSHPREAYHSDTDDSYPIATTIGCVSIVIPNFASGNFLSDRVAIYRLQSDQQWIELDDSEWRELIEVHGA